MSIGVIKRIPILLFINNPMEYRPVLKNQQMRKFFYDPPIKSFSSLLYSINNFKFKLH